MELLAPAIMEILVAVLAAVVSIVVAYVGTAAKKFLDSRQVHEYSAAVRDFDPAIADALAEVAVSTRRKVMEVGRAYGEGEQRGELERHVHAFARTFQDATGVRATESLTPERIEGLIDVAVAEAKRSWSEAYRDEAGGDG